MCQLLSLTDATDQVGFKVPGWGENEATEREGAEHAGIVGIQLYAELSITEGGFYSQRLETRSPC